MLNFLMSFAASLLVSIVTYLILGNAIAAAVPAVLIFAIVFFLIARTVGNRVTAEMNLLVPLLQERKIKEAETHLLSMQRRFGRWQFLLSGQLDAQRGMIRYMQMKFPDALPLLERGQFRNWAASLSIGCIHHRDGAKDKAWKSFEKAAKSAPKEPMVYLVWATLLTRDGKREEALSVLSDGLTTLPENTLLAGLQKTVANRRKIEIKRFPQSWYQFFPEDMMKQMVRGKKGGPGENVVYKNAPHPQPKVSKKMRRGG